MKNLLLSIIAVTFFVISISAQKKEVFGANFTISEEVKIKPQLYTLGESKGFTYTVTTKGFVLNGIPIGFKYIINKWNKKREIELSKSIIMKTDDYKVKMSSPAKFELINGKILFFTNKRNRDSKLQEVFVSEYSGKDLSFVRTKKLAKLKTYKDKSSISSYVYKEINSVDEFGVLIKSPISETKQEFILQIINDKLDIKYEDKIKMESEYASVLNFKLHNDYVFYVIKDRGMKDKGDKVIVNYFDFDSGDKNQFQLDFSNIGDINDFNCDVKNGYLYVSGFYKSNSGKSNDAAGAFSQRYILESGELDRETKKKFDFEFITEKMTDRQVKKAKKKQEKGKDFDAFSFLIRKVLINRDGSSVIVGERFRHYVTSTTDSRGYTTTTHHYVYSDLIMVKTNEDGEITWMKRYEKYLNTTAPDKGSFLLNNKQESESFSIIYNEGGKIIIAILNKEDGESKFKTVYSVDDFGRFAPMIGLNVKIAEYKYDIPLVRYGKTKFMTVTFED